MKSVLLLCGTGASSGFMAANMRKAAKEAGLEINVKARSDSEVEDYIEEIDVLLIGPHLKYMLEDLEEYAAEYDVPVRVISQQAYGNLDGAAALAEIQDILTS